VGAAVGAVAVAVTALAIWLLPTTFSVGTAFDRARLAWPTSYWNATGLMAGLGLIWCLAVTTAMGMVRWARVAAAGAFPLLTAEMYFTVCRGAVAAGVLGLLVFCVAGRSTAWPPGHARSPPRRRPATLAQSRSLMAKGMPWMR
jgi:small-conductance mechanosensitive channel